MHADHLVTRTVPGTVAEAAERLTGSLTRRGIVVFGIIDHAANARSVGLDLQDEVVVIFGDPRVGTSLMLEDPAAGIDLPLRMALWDDHGTTTVAYRNPALMAEQFHLSGHAGVTQKLAGLLAQLAEELGQRFSVNTRDSSRSADAGHDNPTRS